MKKKIYAVAGLLALVLAGTTTAATSSPSTGNWNGHFTGSKTGLGFTVTASGKHRVVNLFASNGVLKEPCANAHGASTAVSLIPSATVDHSGRFKARFSFNSAFGVNSSTVSGAFKSKRAASGTVAIVDTTSRCSFTVHWTAAFEPPSSPVAGATYRGKSGIDQVGGGTPVTFHVSADGTKLTSIKWHPPVVFSNCPGYNGAADVSGHNVAIHGGKFTFKIVRGKITHGSGATTTDTINGQFLAGRKAAGTITTIGFVTGIGRDCPGSNTWTAHG